ncbi:hypothetical protein D3C72_1812940 [compost metagenome]
MPSTLPRSSLRARSLSQLSSTISWHIMARPTSARSSSQNGKALLNSWASTAAAITPAQAT